MQANERRRPVGKESARPEGVGLPWVTRDADPVQVHRRYVEQRLWSGNAERTETEAEALSAAEDSGADDSGAEDSGAEDSGAEDSGAGGSGGDAQVPATQEERHHQTGPTTRPAGDRAVAPVAGRPEQAANRGAPRRGC